MKKEPILKNAPLELPAWWTESDVVKPPCFGQVFVFLNKEGQPHHPLVLWKARLMDRVFYVYRSDRASVARHGYRIDHPGGRPSTYPNRYQFERALFSAQDAAMDHNIALEQEGGES